MKLNTEERERWKEREPFSAVQAEKDAFFSEEMEVLTEQHRRACPAYDAICGGQPGRRDGIGPYLPVALFKDLELRSVAAEDVVRQVTSSGTTGQQVSRIYLDAATAELQRWALASITGDFIGGRRMPMLIIDSPDVLRDRRKFSARGAGILGFSMMSSKRFYALDERMQPDWASIEAFQEAAAAGPSFAFGFTFMIWSCFYQALKASGRKLELSGCYLIHGGGWKKLQDQSVSDEVFRSCLQEQCGFGQISDYYGMAEQTGSIFMQCSEGHLHASNFSDIEALDPLDFSPCRTGKPGLLALRSWIPVSYPGHQLLTEDWGRILGTDDCPCGRKGKYFEVQGRIRRAEIRGCSDTFAASAEENTTNEKRTDDAGPADMELLAGTWPVQEDTRRPFDPLVLSFLGELSQLFMKDPDYRSYPDIYALGFWLREAHRKQLTVRQEARWKQRDMQQSDMPEASVGAARRRGRGIVLHIAPSNMPAMFAYSWITALLAGCPSIVRLSGRDAPVSDRLLHGIRKVMDQPAYASLRQTNAFVRFPRGSRFLEEISAGAAARMIWGGDETVARISAVPKPAAAVDITFPDKYSAALLDEDAVAAMTEEELRLQANLFCRDSYGADQNACSSPRSVFWVRSSKAGVRDRWWDAVASEAKRYDFQPWMATEKFRLLCRQYAETKGMGPVQTRTNRLYVIPCGAAADWAAANDCLLPEARLGMFYEFDIRDTAELMPLLGNKLQTVVCIGTEPDIFMREVREAGCPGVDRAVRAGEALEFDTVWDRKDLIDLLVI